MRIKWISMQYIIILEKSLTSNNVPKFFNHNSAWVVFFNDFDCDGCCAGPYQTDGLSHSL